MNKEIKLGTKEYLDVAQQTLDKSIRLIAKSIDKGLADTNDDIAMSFSLMTGPILDTSHSLLVLSSMGKMRDCYSLSRIVFDHVLNLGYFGAKGEETVKKALQHYHQKAFRDLDRKIEIKDLAFGIGLKDIDKAPISDKLKEALNYFTSKKGFEIRSWTGDNVFKKVEIIRDYYGKEIGMMLVINLFFIYRHSSEIMHGTLFGSLFARGMTKPESEQPNDEKELKKFHRTRISFILICSILLNYVTLYIINRHYPRQKEMEELAELIKDFRITMYE
ncbi:DUF5677 domain-containing protein [Zobellia barbeyronii]|uniref:Uncharacterized protein n=1 Tax=Zobellia barbeyronii TaxID=2748009 RepID=A0ABS5WHJ8_9FLAO|nr:DUF5677 domain-containing protein [Zobellia barbeyronii]MBT2162310.1 hypothetical protein [Zobellia barbeyronii]